MSKKIILYIVLVVALGGALTVLAQSTTTAPTPTTTAASPAGDQKMVVQIGPEGNTLLRGLITSISASSITVKSWGGDWTVNITSSSQVLPAKANNDISKFKVGDFVGVQGVASKTAAWTIDAKLVRNWVYKEEQGQRNDQGQQEREDNRGNQGQQNGQRPPVGPQNNQELQQKIQAILDQINKIQQQINAQQPAQQIPAQ